MGAYRVVDGTQANLDGTVHPAGAVVDIDDARAFHLVRAGVLVAVPAKKPPARSK